jgi:hypothetical protein
MRWTEMTQSFVATHFAPESLKRRMALAFAIYVTCTLAFGAVAGNRLLAHTPYNHFAHLADAWIHGRQSIVSGGPSYAQGNDFAQFQGKTFISFPPFPSVLMLPLVAIAGSPEDFRDGQFIVWLAGLGPAFLFLALEKAKRLGESVRSERENLALAGAFAFGSVYFFTAVQGTVWFAGHVVGVFLLSAYLWAAIGAERPWLAGTLLGCAFLTRPTMSYAALYFGLEAVRASGGIRALNLRALTKRMLPFGIPHRVCALCCKLDELYTF